MLLACIHPGAVKQLLASFVWDAAEGQASVLLPASLVQATPSWARYLTLCVVGYKGLEVVGELRALAELDCVSAEPQPWRTGRLPAVPHAESEAGQLLDCSLIKQLGVSESGSRQGWHASVHVAPGGSELVVDVLVPAAHPPGGKATI